MRLLINITRLFVRTDKNLILFVSTGGKCFNDSPRAIYEEMKKDNRFTAYRLVWAFRYPEQFSVKNSIKIDTIRYYIVALRARCWITNVEIDRGIGFRGKNTYYFHTTHTTLPKMMGEHAVGQSNFQRIGKHNYDCSCAQSQYEASLQQSMFSLDKSQILLSGYPKNDRLANSTEEDYIRIRNNLNLSNNKKVILYAPTYREGTSDKWLLEIDFKKWKKILEKQFIVLFRAHPSAVGHCNLDECEEFVRDVSGYPDNNDLMIASDILISDYSGIFFEFAVLERPMYCYAFDYETYVLKRQLYFDIRKEIPGGFLNENELLMRIKSGLSPKEADQLVRFREKYVAIYGHATEICVKNIYDHIAGK